MKKDHLSVRVLGIIIAFQFLCLCGNVCHAQNLDVRLLRSIHNDRNTSLDGFMKGASNTLYPVAVAVPLTQLIYGYSAHDQTTIRNGWTSVAALGITTAVTFGLKYTIRRDRPGVTYHDIQPYSWDTSPSFPSGHASTAFSTATILSLQYPKWYVIAPSYLWAGTVAYSRLHLGAHYPSDVAAGALIGAGSAFLSYKLNKWIQRKHSARGDMPDVLTAP